MKNRLKKYLLLLISLSLPLSVYAGGNVYTRKMKLADFPSKMMKVVLTGNGTVDQTLQQETASRWILSAYEFCRPEDYERDRTDNAFYFLRFTSKGGVSFLTLSKGGKVDDANTLNRPFDILSIPVAPEGTSDNTYYSFVQAYLDIIQEFVSEAMRSDTKAYSGLQAFNISNLNGKSASTDSNEKSARYMEAREPDTVVGIVIAPEKPAKGDICYKMLISAETHKLYMYRTHKISEKSPAGFLRSDLVRIYGHSGK